MYVATPTVKNRTLSATLEASSPITTTPTYLPKEKHSHDIMVNTSLIFVIVLPFTCIPKHYS